MTRVRSDLWCGAFVRRLNDRGTICVVSRRGDPIAGQIWIEFDHLDGSFTLLSPAPATLDAESEASPRFQVLLDRQDARQKNERVARESDFDPDFWLITVESRVLDEDLPIAHGPGQSF